MGHIGGKRVLSPLRHLSFWLLGPIINPIQNFLLLAILTLPSKILYGRTMEQVGLDININSLHSNTSQATVVTLKDVKKSAILGFIQ